MVRYTEQSKVESVRAAEVQTVDEHDMQLWTSAKYTATTECYICTVCLKKNRTATINIA